MVQIKQKSVYGVESPHPRSFLSGLEEQTTLNNLSESYPMEKICVWKHQLNNSSDRYIRKDLIRSMRWSQENKASLETKSVFGE